MYQLFLKPALAKGLITAVQIDSAASHVLRARFKLGFFDRDLSTNPYNKISPSVVGSEKHKELTLEEVKKAMTAIKLGKAPGPDGIVPELLHCLDRDLLAQCVLVLFRSFWSTGSFPKTWYEANPRVCATCSAEAI